MLIICKYIQGTAHLGFLCERTRKLARSLASSSKAVTCRKYVSQIKKFTIDSLSIYNHYIYSPFVSFLQSLPLLLDRTSLVSIRGSNVPRNLPATRILTEIDPKTRYALASKNDIAYIRRKTTAVCAKNFTFRLVM